MFVDSLKPTHLLDQIYQMRHDVYASELAQHHLNARGKLRDNLDAFNVYVAAVLNNRVVGFVSVTPPMNRPYDPKGTAYSIDKYVSREDFPLL